MLVGSKKVDATSGSLVPLIIKFIIPLILMTIIQKLFNAMDIAVLGNLADTTAVASVGATTTIIGLIVDTFVGMSSGARIVLSRLFGMKDNENLKRTIDTSMIIAVAFGIILTVIGFISAPSFLALVDCPEECFEGAKTYIRIYIFAAPAILVYNYGAAVLTSSGDSKRPLYYAISSGLMNVILNLVLCLILEEKVVAVAIATAASQVLAAALVVIRLCRFDANIRLRLTKMRFNLHAFSQLMRFGIPLSLQVMVYPLANLQISSAINSYGVACVAGNSAATTLHDLTASARSSFGTAAATFMGQNIGAKKLDRVRRSMFHCLWMCAAFCLPFAFLEWLFGPVLLKIFLGTDAVAIEFAMTRITILNTFTLFLISNSIMSPAIQAFGYPIFGTVNAVTWVLGFRIFWMACVYPTYTSYSSLIVCFVSSWVLTFITNLIILSIIYHRYKRKVLKQP